MSHVLLPGSPAAALLAACVGMARVPNLAEAPRAFLALFAVAFVSYVLGLWALARSTPRGTAVAVLGVALLCRAMLLPSPPTLSTDAYRYVWDARVSSRGVSPYAHAPWDREVLSLRDDVIFPRLNHPTWRTIYPPAAQAFFRAVYALAPDSVLAMKAALGVAELAALALLWALLARLGLPAWQAAIYAWNPLVLVEIWGSGHLDALVVLSVVAALLASVSGRALLAVTLLALGTLVKFSPAALLPLVLGPRPGPALLLFVTIVTVGYAPILSLGAGALGSLPQYVTDDRFNPGLVRSLIGHPLATVLVAAAWVIWMAWGRRRASPVERAVPLLGGLTLLSPNLFPWYVVWIVPFLAVTPSAGWIAFTGSVVLAYAFFLSTPWAIPAWARVAEFLPLGLAGALAWRRHIRALGWRRIIWSSGPS